MRTKDCFRWADMSFRIVCKLMFPPIFFLKDKTRVITYKVNVDQNSKCIDHTIALMLDFTSTLHQYVAYDFASWVEHKSLNAFPSIVLICWTSDSKSEWCSPKDRPQTTIQWKMHQSAEWQKTISPIGGSFEDSHRKWMQPKCRWMLRSVHHVGVSVFVEWHWEPMQMSPWRVWSKRLWSERPQGSTWYSFDDWNRCHIRIRPLVCANGTDTAIVSWFLYHQQNSTWMCESAMQSNFLHLACIYERRKSKMENWFMF